MVTYDCGLTDAEHSEWQAWMDIYDLIQNLHESVSDITTFLNEYSHSHESEYGISEISEDIYMLFKPALKTLRSANTKIRSHYGIAEQQKTKPCGRPKLPK